RRWRLGLSLLVGGLAAYLLAAHAVRDNFVRGRPATLLDDVHLRNAPAHGLGFVSGHVAVISALVALAWPYLSRRWRTITVLVAAWAGASPPSAGACSWHCSALTAH